MDLIRMIAALVVMMGHVLHIKSSESGFLIGSHLEQILSSGAFAVVVFFGLSGIALRYQTDHHGISLRWFTARIIRLMPVYWVTFLIPVLGSILLNVDISYPNYGFIIATFGLQAISNTIAIPPVNGPLWSLSVELYLSASLLVVGRHKKVASAFIFALLLLIYLAAPGNLIFQALPIFYFGYLLPGIRLRWSRNLFARILIGIIPISVLLLTPTLVQNRLVGLDSFSLTFLLVGFILLTCILNPSPNQSLFSRLSLRSYSLYAIHAPVALFVDKVFFSSFTTTSLLQVSVTIVLILISTEFLFEFVEKPSIRRARKFLSKV
jgi:peptidoglycan/LPS O-acetylase OafA/YrhL